MDARTAARLQTIAQLVCVRWGHRCQESQLPRGYAGPLCIMCAEGHYASGNICKECTASLQTGDIRKAMVIATAIIAAAVVMRRRQAGTL